MLPLVSTASVHNPFIYNLFAGGSGGTVEHIVEGMKKINLLPVGLLDPKDVSRAVLWLLSERNARHWALVYEDGSLSVKKGILFPVGRTSFKTDDPAFAQAYAPLKPTPIVRMNPLTRYRLSPQVVARRESKIGALVYHRAADRLLMLSSPILADILLGLDGSRPLGETLDAFLDNRSLSRTSLPSLVEALARLKEQGVVHEL